MTHGERNIRSARLPGGDLVAAVLDRTVMSLADRGGASNLIGARWADVAAGWISGLAGAERPSAEENGAPFRVSRVARLDDVPQIAAIASRAARQNPDFLIVGEVAGRPTLQAADAKFSIETARSKQVSPDVVKGLLELGPIVTDILGEVEDTWQVLPGVFLTPDYLLTHLMLEHRQGIMRATVKPWEVALVPVAADAFFAPMEGTSVMELLAARDQIRASVATSLLAGLYYMRLARAAFGCWHDATRPLLTFLDKPETDEAAIVVELGERLDSAPSSYQVVKRWNDDVDVIRAQRATVDQAANPPITSRELREAIDAIVAAHGLVAPSMNRVRRRFGAWYRAQLREQVGPVSPPVPDLTPVLRAIAATSRRLAPQMVPELERIVVETGDAERAPGLLAAVTSPETAEW